MVFKNVKNDIKVLATIT